MLRKLKQMGLVYSLSILLAIIIGLLVFAVNVFNPTDANIGLIGAMFGGLISGGLTLAGVYLTLEKQKTKEFMDKYPMVKSYADDILESLDKINNDIEQLNKKDDHGKIIHIVNYEKDEVDRIKTLSISCGGKIFSEVLKVKIELRALLNHIDSNKENDEDGWGGFRTKYKFDRDVVSKHHYRLLRCRRMVQEEIDRKEKQFNTYYGI